MNKALSSTGASLAAGAGASIIVELFRELLQTNLAWSQVVTIGILAAALIAGAVVINHYRYQKPTE